MNKGEIGMERFQAKGEHVQRSKDDGLHGCVETDAWAREDWKEAREGAKLSRGYYITGTRLCQTGVFQPPDCATACIQKVSDAQPAGLFSLLF